MKTVDTYGAELWVGTREQYTSEVRSLQMAHEWLHEYVNKVGLCVTITPTTFIYTGRKDACADPNHCSSAGEPGFVVGLINYPRFPATPEDIRQKALYIGNELRKLYKQFKVTVVFPDQTTMLEDGEPVAPPSQKEKP